MGCYTNNRNDFELKPSLLSVIQQNQFLGSPTDDPNLHFSVFMQYTDIVKANGVSQEAIRLRLFPFSLRDKAILAPVSTFKLNNHMGRVEESLLSQIFSTKKNNYVFTMKVGKQPLIFQITKFGYLQDRSD